MSNTQSLKVKLFADGADLAGMKEMAANPMIKGFTTNPTLMRKAGIADYLAQNPEAGVSLRHGLYKVRFARVGEGKSGGYRTIHFHRAGQGMPVYLLAVYAKNRTSDLTPVQMDGLARVVAVIEAGLRRRQ